MNRVLVVKPGEHQSQQIPRDLHHRIPRRQVPPVEMIDPPILVERVHQPIDNLGKFLCHGAPNLAPNPPHFTSIIGSPQPSRPSPNGFVWTNEANYKSYLPSSQPSVPQEHKIAFPSKQIGFVW